eukprot:CAMPEP_0172520484 /NCGR_PEP_ID=MMETSP1066-20121228/292032_1 /TAXON_ID=671091 /ORGANISM="Coscinodiscus wailesii, Strain CCMP2513" /LENGTH=744 /DNA_ID=CAMNT_0013303257 /DNA_START=275 /DNA_END=2509 /DNA_ORIENTATION=+
MITNNDLDGDSYQHMIDSQVMELGQEVQNFAGNDADTNNAIIPPKDEDRISRHAIASLLNNDATTVEQFCFAVKSLHQHNIIKSATPETIILVFHENDFRDKDKEFIQTDCTANPVMFYPVTFSFPPGFDGALEYDANPRVARQGTKKGRGRKEWGYAQMIRFWTTGIWEHPAVREFDTVMRIDADSCFVDSPFSSGGGMASNEETGIWEHPAVREFDTVMRIDADSCFVGSSAGGSTVSHDDDDGDVEDAFLPGIRGRYVYRNNALGISVNTWVKDLYGFAVTYMEANGISPLNPELWKHIEDTWADDATLPFFHKNFEVSRVSFFRRADVRKWHEALTEREPYGVFRLRWSDANTRVLTMAMFAEPDRILTRKHFGYRHGKECDVLMKEDMASRGEPVSVKKAENMREQVATLEAVKYITEEKGQSVVSVQMDKSESFESTEIEGGDKGIDWGKHAVVALIENEEQLLQSFCKGLKTLVTHHVVKPHTPIVIFHGDDMPNARKDEISQCIENVFLFRTFQFSSFPEGFDPALEFNTNPKVAKKGTDRIPKRPLWSYIQTTRFWTTLVWKEPIIHEFVTIMRFDTDSCFVAPDGEGGEVPLPAIAGRHVFHNNGLLVGDNTAWSHDLLEFAASYLRTNDLKPRNPSLWNKVQTAWETEKTLPIYHKHFEVSRVSFFRRTDVMKWHEALTEMTPFSLLRHGWSDARIRVLTMAMFAKSEWILTKKHEGYRHGRTICAEYYRSLK